jgi:hypothetical protein
MLGWLGAIEKRRQGRADQDTCEASVDTNLPRWRPIAARLSKSTLHPSARVPAVAAPRIDAMRRWYRVQTPPEQPQPSSWS